MLADNMQILLALLGVTGALVIAIYGWRAGKKRQKELDAWARDKGLTLTSGTDNSFDDAHSWFDCLQQGHSRYANNIITGQWERLSFLGFDYHYKTGSGKHETSHAFSGIILGAPFPLKPLLIRPEHMFDKVAEFFGVDDIDFESAEFSRKFYVKGSDKRWAYDIIHQRAMEFLLANPRFTIQFAPLCVMIRHEGSLFSAKDYDSAARIVCGLLEMIPDYVVRQQTSDLKGQGA